MLAAYLPDLLAIAVAAFTAPPWNETALDATGAGIRLVRDRMESGYVAALARIDEQACGFAYAVSARRLERLATRTTSIAPPFELRELAVDPRYRGLGIGAGMHDALISARPDTPRYLVTHPAAHAALALYRARGWRSTAVIEHWQTGPRLLMHRFH